MKKIPLFSTNICIFYVKEWKDAKDEILSLIPDVNDNDNENSKNNDTKDIGLYHNDGATDFYTDFFDPDDPKLFDYRNKFQDLISPYVNEFIQHTPKKKIKYIKHIWCQKYSKNDYHPPHDHGQVGYSAIFLANTVDEKRDGTLFFSNHWDEYGERASLKTSGVEGSLIFFPSYLTHSSTIHYSDKKRIIISMNFAIE